MLYTASTEGHDFFDVKFETLKFSLLKFSFEHHFFHDDF